MREKKINFDKNINRLGTYCTQWDFVEDRFGKKDLLPFTISDTDFAIPSEVKTRLLERVEHGVLGYTRWNHNDFKQSISKWFYNRQNIHVNEQEIVYTPSVMYGVSKIIELVSKVGDGVVIQTPAYDAFFKTIRGTNRNIIENPLIYDNGYYRIDFEHLETILSSGKASILLLCSPHNPTGRVWKEEEIKKIVSLCKENNIFIISDEIHMDIIKEGYSHYSLINSEYLNKAVVTSGTKTFNFPGLVFSYMFITNSALRDEYLIRLKEEDGLSSPSILGMEATMEAYNKCDYWVDELNFYIAKNYKDVLNYINENLPEIIVNNSESTYLMWLDVSKLGFTMDELQARLIDIGKVAIMDGTIYGGNGNQFLRLNIGCTNAKLMKGLKKLKTSIT